jgi:predicted O-linked N-acetylglucosamine transferase (SPINDLY family)
MPDACLPTDGPPQSGPLPTRAQAGLPEQGLVFCCFNASYKISPTAFEVWMRLLEAVPASVLWLRASSPAVRRNLSRAAASHGVDASRLIFAPRTATRAEHHARFSLADLFLDTSPYNGHTTASEALGLAVPVISLRGRSFASRVAASLLETCGLGALAVDSWDDYHDRALELAHAPEDLANLRQHLRRCRASSPLFDASRFCRHLEAAYAAIWDRHAGGATPATIWVPPLAS